MFPFQNVIANLCVFVAGMCVYSCSGNEHPRKRRLKTQDPKTQTIENADPKTKPPAPLELGLGLGLWGGLRFRVFISGWKPVWIRAWYQGRNEVYFSLSDPTFWT